ncbi:MAG TPA: FAD-dependent oxidoreductase [Candidatus Competibacteraceae bacterium]|nr:FAD-dependent oxidoreductase [Candidatus Competibacteraceae bacterium]
MSATLPDRVDVVIIGGGIVGCSIAYHLTRLGITDVLLLERRQLTCGTTWHAAGLIGQLRATRRLTELAKYTSELLYELERETGQATGFKQNGSLSLALHAERFEELKRGASMAKNFGLEVQVIGPGEARELWPLLELDGVVGAVYLPKDGQANPIDTTQAYAKGARARGARIVEGVKVERILVENGRAVGVRTADGEVRAATVVLAAGMWSRQLAADIGVSIPLHAAEHFYIVTEPLAEVPRELPVLRVPDECVYYKEDAGKLLVGAFEPVAKPWGMQGIPEDFAFDALPDDVDHFAPILEQASRRVPLLGRAGIQTFFNGPESFTPDDRYLLGETAEVRDLFVACGFNSIGIQSSGGAGKVLAEWIRDRRPPLDLVDVDVRRMQPFQSNRRYLHDRTTETLGLLYAMHWPFRQYETARGVRRSPFHEQLLAAGAVMGELAGWERPNWFAPPGVEPRYAYSWGRQNWFDHCAAECRAVRDAVALFDQSSFAKYLVQGRDALAVLNRLSVSELDVPVGRVVYTQWLNERGGIESDLTITRTAEDAFLVVTSAAAQTRDFAWLRRHIPADAHCLAVDLTSGLPMLGVMGPHSRALLERLSGEDLSNAAFPFASSRELEIGYARVRASRITYVGELGWELYIPAEFASHVFDTLVAAGGDFGLRFAGYHAMHSCRMEKGYRHWGHDISIEDTPLEAGLGFCVAWDKPAGFIGRDALLRQREQGLPRRRLVHFRLEDPTRLLYHEEPIWLDGRIVGAITSGMYGHRLEASLGMGYVEHPEGVSRDWLENARFEIEVAWERVPAQASVAPFYDPRNERVRA